MEYLRIVLGKTSIDDIAKQISNFEGKGLVASSSCHSDGSISIGFEESWCVGRIIIKNYPEEECLIVKETESKWILHDKSTVGKKTHRSPGPIYNSISYHSTDKFIPENERDAWIQQHTEDYTKPDKEGFAIGVEVRRKIGFGPWSYKSPEWDNHDVTAYIVESLGNNWKLSNGAIISKIGHYECNTQKQVWYELETAETKASFKAQQKARSISCSACGKLFDPSIPENNGYEEFNRYDHGTPWGVMGQSFKRCPFCGNKQDFDTPVDTGKTIIG